MFLALFVILNFRVKIKMNLFTFHLKIIPSSFFCNTLHMDDIIAPCDIIYHENS